MSWQQPPSSHPNASGPSGPPRPGVNNGQNSIGSNNYHSPPPPMDLSVAGGGEGGGGEGEGNVRQDHTYPNALPPTHHGLHHQHQHSVPPSPAYNAAVRYPPPPSRGYNNTGGSLPPGMPAAIPVPPPNTLTTTPIITHANPNHNQNPMAVPVAQTPSRQAPLPMKPFTHQASTFPPPPPSAAAPPTVGRGTNGPPPPFPTPTPMTNTPSANTAPPSSANYNPSLVTPPPPHFSSSSSYSMAPPPPLQPHRYQNTPPPPMMVPLQHAQPSNTAPPPPPPSQYEQPYSQSRYMNQPPPPPPPSSISNNPYLVPQHQHQPPPPMPQPSAAPNAYPPQSNHPTGAYSNNNYPNNNNNFPNNSQTMPEVPSYLQPIDEPAPIYRPREALFPTTSPAHNPYSHPPHNSFSPTPPPLPASAATTTTNGPPPPANSRYIVVDDGNASPRLIRATSFLFPKDSRTERKLGLGMGLACSPLAVASEDYAFVHPDIRMGDDDGGGGGADGDDHNGDDDSGESKIDNEVESVPVISMQSTNSGPLGSGRAVQPIRCKSCQAYINPFTQVTDEGRDDGASMLPWPLSSEAEFKFRCNFCGTLNKIFSKSLTGGGGSSSGSGAYGAAAGATGGKEMDVWRLPLKFGTVEYEVGGSYITRKPAVVAEETDSIKLARGVVITNTDVVVPSPVHLYALDTQDWKKLRVYLDAIRCVANGLGVSWDRQETFRKSKGYASSGLAPRIGLVVYSQDSVILPHCKKTVTESKQELDNSDDDENREFAVTLMTDINDPFCPLPISEWTYDVSSKAQLGALDKLLQEIPSIINQLVRPTSTHPSTSTTTNNSNNEETKNCGGAALMVLAHALETDEMYTAGRCTLLTSSRPNHGAGAIRDRQEGNINLYRGGKSEAKLFTPLQKQFQQKKTSAPIDGSNSTATTAKCVDGSGHSRKRNGFVSGMAKDRETASFYHALGQRCAQANATCTICITTPLGHEYGSGVLGRHYLDVATLGELCSYTGGKLKWLRVEDSDILIGARGVESEMGIDGTYGHQLREELLQSADAFAGSDAVFKLRCSSGVQVKSYLPKKVIPGVVIDESFNDSPELEMSCVTPDTTIFVDLNHRVGGIQGDNPIVYFQTALLYTNAYGRRRVRVTTLGLRTTTSPGDILRTADIGAVTAMVTRRAIGNLCDESYSEGDVEDRLRPVRKGISSYYTEVLDNYKQGTIGSGLGTVEELLKMLNLFCNSLCHSRMFQISLSSSNLNKPLPLADERAYHLMHGARISSALAMLCVHPNLYRITGMQEDVGDWVLPQPLTSTTTNGLINDRLIQLSCRPYVRLPQSIQPTIAFYHNDNNSLDGIYMLDDGFTIYIYVSPDTDKDIRCELLTYTWFDDDGCENSTEVSSGLGDGFVTPSQTLVLSNTSDIGKKVWRIIRQHRKLSTMGGGNGMDMNNRPTIASIVVVIGKGGQGHRKPLDDDLENEVMNCLSPTIA